MGGARPAGGRLRAAQRAGLWEEAGPLGAWDPLARGAIGVTPEMSGASASCGRGGGPCCSSSGLHDLHEVKANLPLVRSV